MEALDLLYLFNEGSRVETHPKWIKSKREGEYGEREVEPRVWDQKEDEKD